MATTEPLKALFENKAMEKVKKDSKRLSVERIYQKKTQLEHILLRPDTYIGSVEHVTQQMWVFDEDLGMNCRDVTYVPGLYKIFDEILVNAADNKQRDKNMSCIKINIDPENNTISVWNNGKGIPVVEHKVEKVFVPALIFGQLLTSSNYDDEQKKVTGGRNGYGAKLCNIFSTKFTVETACREFKKTFKQSWYENMARAGDSKIRPFEGEDFTCITFQPDLPKFKMETLDRDTVALMSRRAYDIAGASKGVKVFLNGKKLPIPSTALMLDQDTVALMSRRAYDIAGASKGVKVFLNGKKLPVSGFRSYVDLYVKDKLDETGSPLKVVHEVVNDRWEVCLTMSEKGFQQISFVNSIATTKVSGFRSYVDLYVKDKLDETGSPLKVVHEVVNDRWEVCLTMSEKGFQQISFVNSIATTKGGRHVDYVADQIVTKLIEVVKKKNKAGVTVKPFQANSCGIVESVMNWVRFKAQSQLNKKCSSVKHTKIKGVPKLDDANDAGREPRCPSAPETLQREEGGLGKTCCVPARFHDANSCGIVESVMNWVRFKAQSQLNKKCSSVKHTKIKGVPKLDDANDAGREPRCPSAPETLQREEGGLGKTCCVPARFHDEVRTPAAAPSQSQLNKKCSSVKHTKIKGVPKLDDANDAGGKNSSGCTLILTEGDSAKTLAVSGLGVVGRDRYGVFPLRGKMLNVREATHKQVSKQKQEIPFYSIPEFEEWKNHQESTKSWKIKYYKGLGTSTSKEAKEYFADMERHRIAFRYAGPEDDAAISLAFSKKQVDDRKEWLTNFMEGRRQRRLHGLPEELVLFSNSDNERSIPSVVDGLKPGQRKVLFTCFKRNDKREVKVAQLAGSVAEMSAYHHGEPPKSYGVGGQRSSRAATGKPAGARPDYRGRWCRISLMMTIINLAQNFVGSNNLNLLQPVGQFGTRLHGGKDAASPRYIFTLLSPLARLLFPAVDDNLLKNTYDDNQKVEPEWYIPIIPTVLLNGAQGIGTGWACHIPNFDVREVVNNVRRMLDGDEPLPMLPSYKTFKGTVQELGPNQYLISGEISVLDSTTIEISELPAKTWTQTYKEQVLEPMLNGTEKTQPKVKISKIVVYPLITDYKEYHTDTTVRFVVKMTEEKLAEAEAAGLHKVFKLQTPLTCNSMVMFDHVGCMKKYETVQDILKEFFDLRVKYYDLRKGWLLGMLGAESGKLTNQARFILEKIEGTLVIENKPKKELIRMLQEMGYDSDPVKAWKESQEKTYKEQVLEPMLNGTEKTQPLITDYKEYHTDTTVRFVVKMTEEKLAEAEAAGLHKVFKLQTPLTCNSMLDGLMSVSKCSVAPSNHLESAGHSHAVLASGSVIQCLRSCCAGSVASGSQLTELNTLKRKSPSDLWKEDLAAFVEELERVEAKEREEAAAGIKPVKGKAGKPKAVKLIQKETMPSPQGRRVVPRVTTAMKADASKKIKKRVKAEDGVVMKMEFEESGAGDNAAQNSPEMGESLAARLTKKSKRETGAQGVLASGSVIQCLRSCCAGSVASGSQLTELNTLKRKSPSDLWKEDLAAFVEELERVEAKEREEAAAGIKPVKGKAGKPKAVKLIQKETMPSPQGRRVVPRVTTAMKADASKKIKKRVKAEDGVVMKMEFEESGAGDNAAQNSPEMGESLAARLTKKSKRGTGAQGGDKQPSILDALTKPKAAASKTSKSAAPGPSSDADSAPKASKTTSGPAKKPIAGTAKPKTARKRKGSESDESDCDLMSRLKGKPAAKDSEEGEAVQRKPSAPPAKPAAQKGKAAAKKTLGKKPTSSTTAKGKGSGDKQPSILDALTKPKAAASKTSKSAAPGPSSDADSAPKASKTTSGPAKKPIAGTAKPKTARKRKGSESDESDCDLMSPPPPESEASPPETGASPRETGASPPESEASPPETGAPPPESGASPPESEASPPESGASPPESGAPPPETGASPPESGAPPPESGAPPPESGASPPESGASAETGASPPESEASPPESGASPPETEASPPETGASPPESEASPPESGASPPETEASPPESGASPPETEASPPESGVSPETGAPPPESGASPPESGASPPVVLNPLLGWLCVFKHWYCLGHTPRPPAARCPAVLCERVCGYWFSFQLSSQLLN
ncbi:UNVERIFIED_CONTAM: hypothetical protein FKN15_036009 [Acipenser sinensis]